MVKKSIFTLRYEILSCTSRLLVEFRVGSATFIFRHLLRFFEVSANFLYESLKNKIFQKLLAHHRLEFSDRSETSEWMSMRGQKATAKSAASYSESLMMVDHPSET